MNLMKINLLICSVLLSIAACRGPEGMPGPQGPQGPQGPPGSDGQGGIAAENLVFEVEDINFEAPEYGIVIDFMPEDEVLISDVVLVYFLWDSFEDGGEIFDVWRPLPITTFPQQGTLVYTFDHTDIDVNIFLDADFNIAAANLGAAELNDWVARVVVLRAEFDGFANGRFNAPVDLNDYNAVKEYYDLPDLPKRRGSMKIKRPPLAE